MSRGAWAAGHGFLVATLLLAALATADVARAQDIVVDGEIVTAYDIDQRTKFDRLATHRTPLRQEVIEELRRETLTLHRARRRLGDVADAAVEQAYANMAARMRLTPAQLTAALANQGIDERTLKRRIRADIAWQQMVRLKMRVPEPLRVIDPPLPKLIDPLLPKPRLPPGPRWCAQCLQLGRTSAPPAGDTRGDQP